MARQSSSSITRWKNGRGFHLVCSNIEEPGIRTFYCYHFNKSNPYGKPSSHQFEEHERHFWYSEAFLILGNVPQRSVRIFETIRGDVSITPAQFFNRVQWIYLDTEKKRSFVEGMFSHLRHGMFKYFWWNGDTSVKYVQFFCSCRGNIWPFNGLILREYT